MAREISPMDYTWRMLESDRARGEEFVRETLDSISEKVEEALAAHGMDIPDVEVLDHPDLEDGMQGSTTYNPTPDLDGLIYIGSKASRHPDSIAPRVSDTLAEEYMHIQFEAVEDFDVPTGMGIDILGSVWTLYSQGKLDEPEAVEDIAYYSRHGYGNSGDYPDGYGEMVEEGIHDLVEDFEDTSSEETMMEYALQNPEQLFQQYNEDLLE